jgi:hypothetical protein
MLIMKSWLWHLLIAVRHKIHVIIVCSMHAKPTLTVSVSRVCAATTAYRTGSVLSMRAAMKMSIRRMTSSAKC